MELILFLAAIIVAIIGFFLKMQFDRLDELEEEQKEIKENYLTRFEEVNENINSVQINLLKEFQSLRDLIINKLNK